MRRGAAPRVPKKSHAHPVLKGAQPTHARSFASVRVEQLLKERVWSPLGRPHAAEEGDADPRDGPAPPGGSASPPATSGSAGPPPGVGDDGMRSLVLVNVQLSFLGMLFASVQAIFVDGAALARNGPFNGFNRWAVCNILLQAVGGLLVAYVVKYTDNIVKGFATALSIVLSLLLSCAIYGVAPAPSFLLGVALVICAFLLYAGAVTLPWAVTACLENVRPPSLQRAAAAASCSVLSNVARPLIRRSCQFSHTLPTAPLVSPYRLQPDPTGAILASATAAWEWLACRDTEDKARGASGPGGTLAGWRGAALGAFLGSYGLVRASALALVLLMGALAVRGLVHGRCVCTRSLALICRARRIRSADVCAGSCRGEVGELQTAEGSGLVPATTLGEVGSGGASHTPFPLVEDYSETSSEAAVGSSVASITGRRGKPQAGRDWERVDWGAVGAGALSARHRGSGSHGMDGVGGVGERDGAAGAGSRESPAVRAFAQAAAEAAGSVAQPQGEGDERKAASGLKIVRPASGAEGTPTPVAAAEAAAAEARPALGGAGAASGAAKAADNELAQTGERFGRGGRQDRSPPPGSPPLPHPQPPPQPALGAVASQRLRGAAAAGSPAPPSGRAGADRRGGAAASRTGAAAAAPPASPAPPPRPARGAVGDGSSHGSSRLKPRARSPPPVPPPLARPPPRGRDASGTLGASAPPVSRDSLRAGPSQPGPLGGDPAEVPPWKAAEDAAKKATEIAAAAAAAAVGVGAAAHVPVAVTSAAASLAGGSRTAHPASAAPPSPAAASVSALPRSESNQRGREGPRPSASDTASSASHRRAEPSIVTPQSSPATSALREQPPRLTHGAASPGDRHRVGGGSPEQTHAGAGGAASTGVAGDATGAGERGSGSSTGDGGGEKQQATPPPPSASVEDEQPGEELIPGDGGGGGGVGDALLRRKHRR